MPQFSVYRNPGANRRQFPLLLDIQNDLLSDLQARMVIPLRRKDAGRLPGIRRLTSEIAFQGQTYLLMTYQLAAVPLRDLGEEVGDLREVRDEILGALDLLIVGF